MSIIEHVENVQKKERERELPLSKRINESATFRQFQALARFVNSLDLLYLLKPNTTD